MKLIGKGAEANLYLKDWYGRKVIHKIRVPKKYRLKKIDLMIRKYRTVHEAQMLHDAKHAGVSTPIIYHLDRKKFIIIMEYIEGTRLKEGLQMIPREKRISICRLMGRDISALHKRGIIHGDLTTSNIILTRDNMLFFLDFGLSYYSWETEDRGVDLHLIKRALNSSHYQFAKECFSEIMKGYQKKLGGEETRFIFEKVKEIARRGRYFPKDMKMSFKALKARSLPYSR